MYTFSSRNALVGALLSALGPADLEVRDRWEQTPLYLAAHHGDASVVIVLVRRGARLDSALPTGETPLDAAIRRGNADAESVLRDAGASEGTDEGGEPE